jgi:hypothetical protein
VATPFAASWFLKINTALVAPRILKAPTFWKFSHLKNNSASHILFMALQVRTGVQ